MNSEATKVVITISKLQGPVFQTVSVDSLNNPSGNYTFSKLDSLTNYSVVVFENLGKRKGPESDILFTTGKDCILILVASLGGKTYRIWLTI